MLTLASIAVSLTIGLLLLVNFVHGQEQRQVPRMDTIDDVLSFCRLFPGVDITEGVEKGNVSKLFTATTCEEWKEIGKDRDKLRDSIKDAFTLDELEKQKNNK
jgi:hypothetical protein